jgi:hypothetical protein
VVAGADGTFVGGTFTFAGQTAAQNLALWNGAHWSALGSGVNGSVYALCRLRSELFVGGRFTTAGGLAATNLARWDGTNWSAVGRNVNGTVHALACSDREFFAGGMFTFAGGVTASNIARWDGTNWSALGAGVAGGVRALAFGEGVLHADASFRSAGGVNATNIARWDGANWSALGSGVGGTVSSLPRIRPPPVSALALAGKELFVGGDFAQAGNVPATNVARWDGTHWTPLGDGLEFGYSAPPGVAALAIRTGELIVGGRFEFAGGWPASDFSVWHFPPRLRITRLNQAVELSWPSAAAGYVLQAAETLESPVWRPVTNPPVALGGETSVIESTSHRTFFYRLLKE